MSKLKERKDNIQEDLHQVSKKAMEIYKLSDRLSGSLWQCIDILDDDDSDLYRSMSIIEIEIIKWSQEIPKQIADIQKCLKSIGGDIYVLDEQLKDELERAKGKGN